MKNLCRVFFLCLFASVYFVSCDWFSPKITSYGQSLDDPELLKIGMVCPVTSVQVSNNDGDDIVTVYINQKVVYKDNSYILTTRYEKKYETLPNFSDYTYRLYYYDNSSYESDIYEKYVDFTYTDANEEKTIVVPLDKSAEYIFLVEVTEKSTGKKNKSTFLGREGYESFGEHVYFKLFSERKYPFEVYYDKYNVSDIYISENRVNDVIGVVKLNVRYSSYEGKEITLDNVRDCPTNVKKYTVYYGTKSDIATAQKKEFTPSNFCKISKGYSDWCGFETTVSCPNSTSYYFWLELERSDGEKSLLSDVVEFEHTAFKDQKFEISKVEKYHDWIMISLKDDFHYGISLFNGANVYYGFSPEECINLLSIHPNPYGLVSSSEVYFAL